MKGKKNTPVFIVQDTLAECSKTVHVMLLFIIVKG